MSAQHVFRLISNADHCISLSATISGFILSFELKSRNANHSETLTRVISSFSAYLYNFEARTLARTQILDTKSISRAFRNRPAALEEA
ncbi:unnamed protein product [Somion occarium]|uniref:Uncharacterized protein n=1 Tax=Somion occarium TaxID=3059160 RepID=A0ABP1D2V4_9APHY